MLIKAHKVDRSNQVTSQSNLNLQEGSRVQVSNANTNQLEQQNVTPDIDDMSAIAISNNFNPSIIEQHLIIIADSDLGINGAIGYSEYNSQSSNCKKYQKSLNEKSQHFLVITTYTYLKKSK
ncbi:hypothetical protein [Agarivorans sp. QJM3NY_33]|uniref:hypothetical protein n=1 Tax=Agarivorans sp. QJM3NY_33 TaxID=3421432 RepID=UPI003D7DF4C3